MAMAMTFIFSPLTTNAQTHTDYNETLSVNDEELAQLLAPIALYPDVLLLQILIASSYPFEVAEAERWLARNPHLADDQLEKALEDKDWDTSVLALCNYPNILGMMVENLNWTAKLGDAFVNQQQDVMDVVQDLRTSARDQGNLKTTDEQKVIVEKKIIRIEPVHYNYVYVPVYDPLVIYGPWRYPSFRPFRIYYPGVRVYSPGIVFSARISLGFGFVRWSVFDWPSRNVVIINRDRTKRYDRNYDVYQRHGEPRYWRPDHKRRDVHKASVRPKPGYHPPVKSQPHRAIITPKKNTDRIRTETRDIRTKTDAQRKQPVLKHRSQPVKPMPGPIAKPKSEVKRPDAGHRPDVKPRPENKDRRTDVVQNERPTKRETRPGATRTVRKDSSDKTREIKSRDTDKPAVSRDDAKKEEIRANDRGSVVDRDRRRSRH